MTTSENKNKWHDRLKTADNAYTSELLHNFGLSGGLSVRDLPWAGLAGLATMGIRSKMKGRNPKQEVSDNSSVNNFSDDMSKMREIIDQHKPTRNHPSVPGFQPETKSPYGFFDQDSDGYIGGPPPGEDNITDISEHPRFNSGDQGRSQKGRPFDREEE
jgi:hypothetical protein